MLLPGGATEAGMIPEVFKQSESVDFTFLSPENTVKKTVIFAAGDESNGNMGQRIIPTRFKE